ncbi:DUF559 domain-containing protein [Neorhizobium sp. JUb45]|uniref:endonuclease domain-containing protein n=1 Tax=unclassified Neorhizobium TaxID=2629175 RepID=UPI00104DBF56|nr:DUF559 domain-containing protein [Neorhizobium sp. JUb45]TCR01325.1 very-short-patch-repair endonuclease [Neorhizobium sp. JUb45]
MRGPDQPTTKRARSLRQTDNDAEAKLWNELRNRQLNGVKLMRQFPIGRYFADFACREAHLVVEVDGSQHSGSAHDRHRDDVMTQEGWAILRFWNVDVLTETEAVTETIVAVLDGRLLEAVETAEMRFIPWRIG